MEPISVPDAHRELKQAEDEFKAKRYDVAGRRLQSLRARVEASLNTGHVKDRIIGNSFVVDAEIHFALGRMKQAMEAYWAAEDHLSADSRNRESLGVCLINIVSTMSDTTVSRDPLYTYLSQAEEALTGLDPKYQKTIDRLRTSLADSHEVDPQQQIAERRRSLATSIRPASRARARTDLAFTLLNHGDASSWPEVDTLLRSSHTFFESKRDEYALDQIVRAVAVNRAVPWSGWVPELVARRLTDGRPGADARAWSLLARAAYQFARGDLTAALDDALVSLATYVAQQRRIESSAVRAIASPQGDEARELALSICMETGDARTAAELIESARLGVLPLAAESGPAAANGRDDSLLTTILGSESSGLGPISAVSVAGSSAMASRLASEDVGEVLPLEHLIEQVGGRGAWWWGMWAHAEKIFWCLLRDGSIHTGVIDLSAGTAARSAMNDLEAASPLSWSPAGDTLGSGVLGGDVRSEGALSARLGAELVPAPLREELLRRWTAKDGPLALVCSGYPFSLLPLPGLGVATPPGHDDPLRVVECARISIAPPSALVAHVLRQRRSAREGSVDDDPLHVLACVDPRGDLPFASIVPPTAGTVLGGQHESSGRLATRQRLINQLRFMRFSDVRGVLYYSGHVMSGQSGLGAALCLSDGDTLAAEDLFGQGADGTDGIPSPESVLLAACASAGSAGSGAGEWFGLAAAFLWSGARGVVGTNWPVLDVPFTSWFDERVLSRHVAGMSLVESLRETQLEGLAMWRADTRVERLARGVRSRSRAMPVVWAAYMFTGVDS